MNEPTSSEGIVVILDSLGTKTLGAEECVAYLKNLESVMDFATETLDRLFPQAMLGEATTIARPDIRTFGDTLLFCWASPGSHLDMYVRISGWLQLLFLKGLRHQMRFRGALAFGTYVSSESAVIGPAVADAAAWYEEADWMGVIMTPKTGFHFGECLEEARRLEDVEIGEVRDWHEKYQRQHRSWYVEYPVPLRRSEGPAGYRGGLWSLAWPAALLLPPFKAAWDRPEIGGPRRLMLSLLSRFNIPRGTESKYQNTFAFYEWYEKEVAPTARG